MEPLLLLGLAAAAFLGGKKATAKKLQYIPMSVSIDKKKGTLVYKMDILNPTKRSLDVNSIFASVIVNDKKIGSIEKADKFTIKPNSRTSITLNVKPLGMGIAQLIAAVLLGTLKPKDVFAKVIGTVRSMGIDNPLDEVISFGT